jgi:hypothetical protein
MAEVRKYSVAVHTGCGRSLLDCKCAKEGATTGLVVSTTDDRDIQPLVEAARRVLGPYSLRDQDIKAQVTEELEDRDRLAKALKPFDSKGDGERG